jgi:hypothetical protein
MGYISVMRMLVSVTIHIRIAAAVAGALRVLALKERRSVAGLAALLLEEALKARGITVPSRE